MLSVNIKGNTIEDVAREALQFAKTILGESGIGEAESERSNSWEGYHPDGVGKSYYTPVDDGREWEVDPLRKWLENMRANGRGVIEILAREKIIDQREEAEKLGWSGSRWAGVWTGPRRQAGYVKDSYDLNSWPYGHTYDEPRRMWMHEDIANRVLNIINSLEDEQ